MNVPDPLRAVEELTRLLASLASDLEAAAVGDAMPPAHWHVLTATRGGVGVTMSALAAVTSLPAPSLTRLIDAMVDDNLVLRRPDERDRRRVLVFQTRRGAAAYGRLAARPATATALEQLLAERAPRLVDLLLEVTPSVRASAASGGAGSRS